MGGSEVSISVVKCSEVLQCSDGPSNKVSIFIRRLIDNRKLLFIYIYIYIYIYCYYHILSYSLGSIFYQCIYGCIPV